MSVLLPQPPFEPLTPSLPRPLPPTHPDNSRTHSLAASHHEKPQSPPTHTPQSTRLTPLQHDSPHHHHHALTLLWPPKPCTCTLLLHSAARGIPELKEQQCVRPCFLALSFSHVSKTTCHTPLRHRLQTAQSTRPPPAAAAAADSIQPPQAARDPGVKATAPQAHPPAPRRSAPSAGR